jgi:hypothetical protein
MLEEQQHQPSLEQIQTDLEELISLLAQTSDSTAINLASKFEKFESELELRDQKRWSFFQWFVGGIILLLSVMIPILYLVSDKMQTSINENSRKVSLVEAENRDQVTKHELITAIEKRFTLLESSMKDVATIKDLERTKAELIKYILEQRRK